MSDKEELKAEALEQAEAPEEVQTETTPNNKRWMSFFQNPLYPLEKKPAAIVNPDNEKLTLYGNDNDKGNDKFVDVLKIELIKDKSEQLFLKLPLELSQHNTNTINVKNLIPINGILKDKQIVNIITEKFGVINDPNSKEEDVKNVVKDYTYGSNNEQTKNKFKNFMEIANIDTFSLISKLHKNYYDITQEESLLFLSVAINFKIFQDKKDDIFKLIDKIKVKDQEHWKGSDEYNEVVNYIKKSNTEINKIYQYYTTNAKIIAANAGIGLAAGLAGTVAGVGLGLKTGVETVGVGLKKGVDAVRTTVETQNDKYYSPVNLSDLLAYRLLKIISDEKLLSPSYRNPIIEIYNYLILKHNQEFNTEYDKKEQITNINNIFYEKDDVLYFLDDNTEFLNYKEEIKKRSKSKLRILRTNLESAVGFKDRQPYRKYGRYGMSIGNPWISAKQFLMDINSHDYNPLNLGGKRTRKNKKSKTIKAGKKQKNTKNKM
jgi:hypothetical protein